MKRLADQTFYEILEVPADAPPAVIAEAIEKARALYGPGSLVTYTLVSDEEATLLCRRIEEAQATLLDPAARARYDEQVGAKDAPANGAVRHEPSPVIAAIQVAQGGAAADVSGDGARDATCAPTPTPTETLTPVPPPAAPEVAAAPPEPPPAPTRTPPIPLDRAVPLADPTPPDPSSIPAAPPSSPSPQDATAWTGEVLRKLREARGITLAQLSERTKVTRHHLENIEGDRYGALPAAVYLRGILLSLARELRLDGQKVARSYLERATAATGGQGAPPSPKPW